MPVAVLVHCLPVHIKDSVTDTPVVCSIITILYCSVCVLCVSVCVLCVSVCVCVMCVKGDCVCFYLSITKSHLSHLSLFTRHCDSVQ